ncbi:MAG: hypothetical protein M0P57_07720 [Syntrophales bacterium]|nr:hypothetical protein [Syntrophales bacterium]
MHGICSSFLFKCQTIQVVLGLFDPPAVLRFGNDPVERVVFECRGMGLTAFIGIGGARHTGERIVLAKSKT